MSAGTLTLTNNSAAVGGSGTAFTTELAAGDFILVTVGGVPYTLPVKTINSNTSLTLVSNFTGPTQSGSAWSAVPRLAMNLVTAALVAQSAEALRGLNYDKQNWQQVFSVSGNVTVKLPDGTTYSGPSWKYLSDNMATKTSGAVPVNQGGTGATTESGARDKLSIYSKDEIDSSIKYLPWNDPSVSGASGILTIDTTSGPYELMVRITPTFMHIYGIIRKTMDSGNTALFIVKALPPGKTVVRTPHAMVFLTASTVTPVIVPTTSGGAGTVIRITTPPVAAGGVIVDLKLFFA